jgi:ABC-2 type transport system permease protein
MSDDSGGATGEGSAVAVLDEAMREQFTWYVVAKKEFQDASRSKGLWVLSAVFTLIFLLPVGVVLYIGGVGPSVDSGGLGMRVIIESIYLDLVTTILPIVAIFVGVAAITKERSSGSMKVLLSLPFSRRDVIIGKVLGRCATVAVPFLIAATITGGFFMLSRVSFNGEMYLLFMLYSLLLALVMVAIAVSISGAVSTTVRSFLVNLTVYVYVTFLWNSAANQIGEFLYNQVGVSRSIRWNAVMFLKLFSPTQSYKAVVRSILAGFSDSVQPGLVRLSEQSGEQLTQMGAAQYARYNLFNVRGGFLSPGLPDADKRALCENVVGATYRNVTVTVQNQTQTTSVCTGGSDLPFYLSDPAVVVFMLSWIGIAAAVSYYTFDQVDL